MNLRWKLTGAREMEKALFALGHQVAGRIGTNALRAGAKPIVAEAKRLAPKSKRGRGGRGRGRIGKHIFAVVVPTTNKHLIIIKIGVRAPYGKLAHLLEFGHVSKNQYGGPYGFVPAYPFLRPAMDARAAAAIREIGRVLASGINSAISKINAGTK